MLPHESLKSTPLLTCRAKLEKPLFGREPVKKKRRSFFLTDWSGRERAGFISEPVLMSLSVPLFSTLAPFHHSESPWKRC